MTRIEGLPTVVVVGAVLCGGAGRRMGRPKALMELCGEPMFLRPLRILSEVSEKLAVSVGRGEDPAPYLRQAPGGTVAIKDIVEGAGPVAGLSAVCSSFPGAIVAVAPCDAPLLPASLYRHLVALLEGHDAVVPRTDVPQPLTAVYRSDRLAGAIGASADMMGLSILDALSRLSVREVDARELETLGIREDAFTNVNTPESLRRVEQAFLGAARKGL